MEGDQQRRETGMTILTRNKAQRWANIGIERGLVLLALAIAIVPGGAWAQEVGAINPHTPVTSDGSVVETTVQVGVQGEDGFDGTGEPTGPPIVDSADEFAEMLARRPATGPVGIESIIGADGRVKITNTTTFPASAVALITMNFGTSSFTCTGWLYGKDIVATAGHCVHSGGSSGSWATNVKVYPGRNGSSSPYGSCTSKTLHSVKGWTTSNDEKFDYGAIKLNCTIGDTTGWFGYWWQSASLTGLTSIINGYPGDKPNEQWQSTDQIRQTQTRQVFYKNDTVGGMSGSGVYYNRPSGSQWCTGYCSMAIHAQGLHGSAPHSTHNHGTRIVEAVFNNLKSWKDAP